MFYQSNAKAFEYAHNLRGNTTPAEELLWNHLSKNQLDEYRFKRQHPILNYIADFYCHRAKMIIEVDGEVHEQEERIARDRLRTAKMEAIGCRVIRFINREVMYLTEYVISCIRKELSMAPWPPRQGRLEGPARWNQKNQSNTL